MAGRKEKRSSELTGGSLGGYRLQATAEFEPGRRDVYVLDLVHCTCSCRAERQLVAVTGSSNSISVYNLDNLSLINRISAVDQHGPPGMVTGLCFSANQLWCSSTSGSIRSYDVRHGQKPVCTLQGLSREPFTCIGANCANELLAGGTEKVGDDASVYFWSVRKAIHSSRGREPIAQFTQSHSDDITKVIFSPISPRRFASGSTDGLVCIFDLVTMEEEEAAVSVKNTESSVANVGFFESDFENVYCLTHQETLHVWNTEQVEPLLSETRIRERLREEYGVLVDYFIGCVYQESDRRLLLVSGDHSGGMHIIHTDVEQGEFRPAGMLTGGHSATVRTVQWTREGGSMCSGGEDGSVCLWMPVTRS